MKTVAVSGPQSSSRAVRECDERKQFWSTRAGSTGLGPAPSALVNEQRIHREEALLLLLTCSLYVNIMNLGCVLVAHAIICEAAIDPSSASSASKQKLAARNRNVPARDLR